MLISLLCPLKGIWNTKVGIKILASFLLHIPSYSYFLPSILQTFINATAPSTIHCSMQFLSSITHKQTRSPAHAFLAAKIEFVSAANAQKLTTIYNNQTKR
jgi:hypothetical protein